MDSSLVDDVEVIPVVKLHPLNVRLLESISCPGCPGDPDVVGILSPEARGAADSIWIGPRQPVLAIGSNRYQPAAIVRPGCDINVAPLEGIRPLPPGEHAHLAVAIMLRPENFVAGILCDVPEDRLWTVRRRSEIYIQRFAVLDFIQGNAGNDHPTVGTDAVDIDI